MKTTIVKDGWIYIIGLPLLFGAIGVGGLAAGYSIPAYVSFAVGLIATVFMLYFFRDPHRQIEIDPQSIVSGADGLIRAVEEIEDKKYIGCRAVRISVYLSPFNVHVNRAPMAGKVSDLMYKPGKHLLTRSNASSEHNEHSRILIEGEDTTCLVHQIVGPLVRRVVYWLSLEQSLDKGDRIGIMKFGSRLDVYLPADDVEVLISEGQKVKAGLTPIARMKK
jgi:phosphatidylserine decarboxylase